MVTAQMTLKLGDFGATTTEERLDSQTGTHSAYYADLNARNSKFNAKSDIYAFGLCAYFLIFGVHMYSKENAQAWRNNTETAKKSEDLFILQAMINRCLLDKPEDRPDFKLLAGEIAFELIFLYCY